MSVGLNLEPYIVHLVFLKSDVLMSNQSTLCIRRFGTCTRKSRNCVLVADFGILAQHGGIGIDVHS